MYQFLDFWMVFCIFEVTLQMLQATVVYFVYNKSKNQWAKKEMEDRKKDRLSPIRDAQIVTTIDRIYKAAVANMRSRRKVRFEWIIFPF